MSLVSENPPAVDVEEEPIQYWWTDEIVRGTQYTQNYAFPADPSYDDELIALIDSGSQNRFDFKFAQSGSTDQIVYTKTSDWEDWPENLGGDVVRHIRIQLYTENSNLYNDIVRCVEFFDEFKTVIQSTGHCFGEEKDDSYYTELVSSQRIVGVRADNTYTWTDDSGTFRAGYWRNLQFLIANF
jgi:hypothetical protein